MGVSDNGPRGRAPNRHRKALAAVLERDLSPAQFKRAQSEILRLHRPTPEADTPPGIFFDFLSYDSFILGFATQLCGNGVVVFSPEYTPESLRDMALPAHDELFALYLDPEAECPAFRSYVNALELSRLMVLEFAHVWPERVR